MRREGGERGLMRIGIWGVKWTFAAVAMSVAALIALAGCGTEPDTPPPRIVIIQSSTAAPPPTATPMPPTPAPTATPMPPTPVVASPDRDALITLYNATNGASWTRSDDWLSDRPIGEWRGVFTDDNERVNEIWLDSNGLSGIIPPEIDNLDYLKYLLLDRNDLNGSIPPEVGNLSNLEGVNLGRNQLNGAIPPELGDLSRLRILGFSTIG